MGFFGMQVFFRPVPHCDGLIRKFRYLQKYGYFPLKLSPKLRTLTSFIGGISHEKKMLGINTALKLKKKK